MGVERVKQIYLVFSGKGGVGKSSVSVQLALSLLKKDATNTVDGHDRRIGLLDIDLCGPSIPRMVNMIDAKVLQGPEGWKPAQTNVEFKRHGDNGPTVKASLLVMSIGFLLANQDDAVVWRGPKKTALIRQFINNVQWDELDYLIIDTPPGTSDEHIAIVEALQTHPNVSSIIVTTPQLVALADVEKEITFCRTVGVHITGVIENMSGYICPHCAHCTNLFSSGGGEQLAEKYQIPFLARVPLSPDFTKMAENRSIQIVDAYSEQCQLAPIFREIANKLG